MAAYNTWGGSWAASWGTSWGGAPTGPTALIWGDGLRQWNRKIRGRIPEEVCEIIEEIVQAAPAPVVLADTGKIAKKVLAQQEAALRAELKSRNIAWRKVYREALEQLIEQQNDDETICMLLMM